MVVFSSIKNIWYQFLDINLYIQNIPFISTSFNNTSKITSLKDFKTAWLTTIPLQLTNRKAQGGVLFSNFLADKILKIHMKPDPFGNSITLGGVRGVLFKNFFENARVGQLDTHWTQHAK